MKTDIRAHITKFGMVNWRGVTGNILTIDRLITALEGPNGAGKTTLLAAFYISLMPDMSLLKISNVGDSEGSGGDSGLHGKLGGTGPSYTFLEVVNPLGQRVVAGVQLIPKTSPSVAVAGLFVIKNLIPEIALEDLLALGGSDDGFVLPDIPGLREKVGLHGGDFMSFDTVGDYGAEMFKQGIMPIKLSNNKDRVKFNKLLQTSLQGGFSKDLQDRLKEYLLGEDRNIGNSIERMQENMKRSRETRHLLLNLIEKIDLVEDVQSSGMDVMSAMMAGVKLQAEQQKEDVANAKKAFVEATKSYESCSRAKLALTEKLEERRGESEVLKQKLELAKKHLDATRKACGLSSQIKLIEEELVEQSTELANAAQSLKDAEQEYKAEQKAVAGLRVQFEDVCQRLSDAEDHWTKVSKESGLYQTACDCLKQAQESLPEKEVSRDTAAGLLTESERRLGEICRERVRVDREVAEATEAKSVFDSALETLLEFLENREVAQADAFNVAKEQEALFIKKEAFIQEHQTVGAKIESAAKKALEQAEIRSAMTDLKGQGVYVKSSEELLSSYTRQKEQLEDLGQAVATAQKEVQDLKNVKLDFLREQKELSEKVAFWERIAAQRLTLEERYECEFASRSAVEDQKELELKRQIETYDKKGQLEHKCADVEKELQDLVNNRSSLDPRLGRVELALDGQLVASLYEEIAPEEASEKAARLGPLAGAIMVDDIPAALDKVAGMKNLPEDLWLIEKGPLEEDLRKLKKLPTAIAAPMANRAWRVTQFPKFPIIGHSSRKARIDFLREQKQELQEELQGIGEELDELTGALSALGGLLVQFQILEGPDPRILLDQVSTQIGDVTRQIQQKESKLGVLQKERGLLGKLVETLQLWLPKGHFLDEEDYQAVVESLERIREEAAIAQAWCERKRPGVASLRERLEDLRRLPLSPDAMVALHRSQQVLDADWEFWSVAKSSMFQLVDKLAHFQFKSSFDQLRMQKDPTGELMQQKEGIKKGLDEGQAKESLLRQAVQDNQEAYSKINGDHKASLSQKTRLEKELVELGVEGSERALLSAEGSYNGLESDLGQKNSEIEGLQEKCNSASVRLETAENDVLLARSHRREVLKFQARPLLSVRRFARGAVRGDLTLSRLWSATPEGKGGYASFDAAFGAVDTSRNVLHGKMLEHVRKAKASGDVRGKEVLDSLAAMASKYGVGQERQRVEECLSLWAEMKGYITQILPRDCVDTDDPLLAAQKMHARQKSLAATLEVQERDFRTDSETVANSIRGRIREEKRKITKLGYNLQQVSFGNIASMNIEFSTRDEMMELLDAMTDRAQFDLFSDGLSLQDAMAKVYEQITGGKVVGEDLLDYRKYINLNVRIKRKGASGWDREKKLNLSTGEAIGIGAAVLMVILGSWEEQSSFHRENKDMCKSMRFLFMDEATRLDPESIQTLLDLCRRMGIQLLIAGPKFSGDDCGDGITYSLCRRSGEGIEEVVIRGRRGFGQKDTWLSGAA